MSAAVHQIAEYTARSPQLENGFLRIANELHEAISAADVSKRELKVLNVIIRMTYGFRKKEDDIAASQIGQACRMGSSHVTEALNSLAKKNIITKRRGRIGCVVGIQKDYSLWPMDDMPIEYSLPKKPWARKEPKTETPKLEVVAPSIPAEIPTEALPKRELSPPESGVSCGPNSGDSKDTPSKDIKKKARSEKKISLRTFLANCKAENCKPIPESDPVFKYADEVGIPIDFIRFAWVEFKRKYSAPRAKTYIDWNQHFQNAVRENWYHLWFIKEDAYQLTTRGLQIQKEVKETA